MFRTRLFRLKNISTAMVFFSFLNETHYSVIISVFLAVYSSDLRWVPIQNQDEIFRDCPIRPVYNDILLAKLRPGQVFEIYYYVITSVLRVIDLVSPYCCSAT